MYENVSLGATSSPVAREEGPQRLVDLAEKRAPAGPVSVPVRTSPYVVLVVDDEEDLLESVRAALENTVLGLRVRTASTGLEALHILEQAPVDVIVTDFKMPGMDGFELMDRAERIAPGLPRILISAYVYEVPKNAMERRHLERFLPKPFNIDELVRALADALAVMD